MDSEIPSVRLASGIKMQQRWPSSVLQQHQQQLQKPKDGEALRLIELAPKTGSQGTVVTVVVQSLPRQIVPVKLAFNSFVVDTKQMQSQGIVSLVAKVPPFQHTHSPTANVPISICMLDKDSVTETWPVAEFVYEFDAKDGTTSAVSASTSSSTSFNTIRSYENDKMSAFQQQQSHNNIYQQSDRYLNNAASNDYNDTKYNQYRPDNLSRPNRQSDYTSNPNPLGLFSSNSTGLAGILTEFNQNESVLPDPLPQTPLNYSHQAGASATPQSHFSSHPSVHVPSALIANYHPYPALASRTNLKIMGDLDSMAKNWTTDEWEDCRRLVQFWREQSGNEIRCTFGPVAKGERITTNSDRIVVSCIYWAERNDCFITSVDCIHLLESLMDIRFSVEEKNRVRRNLEGFRPLTVSKCKPDSADFFKLIMSFPNPKPRNIEKDIKVFPWKTLSFALKKIVTKYTASSCNDGTQQQPRRAQLKISCITPTPTTSRMNVKLANDTNNFYRSQSNIYQQPSSQFAYQTQPPQETLSSLYQSSPPSSVPAFSSSYSEASPVLDVNKASPSPCLQYSYNPLLNSNNTHTIDDLDDAAKVITSQKLSPSNRLTSLDNQQEYLVNFEKD